MEARIWAGERVLLRSLTGELDNANRRARRLARTLEGMPGVDDVIVGAASILVVLADGGGETGIRTALAADDAETSMALAADDTGASTTIAADDAETSAPRAREHSIPVVYDGDDLAELATLTGLTAAEIARRHAAAEYRVAFIGFSPGFPYLIGLPPELQAPRRATPRAHVPAGSVAIGGVFTGVYPRETPGGWQLIGRTDVTLFDAARTPPALLRPGDVVRFVAR